jgi:hypothetical protein
MRLKKPILDSLTAMFVLGSVLATSACSVPVFRYALERWPPDNYEALVFHRGPLSPELSGLVKRIDPDRSTNQVLPNLRVRSVDLDAQPEEKWLALWKRLETNAVPWLAVLYPASAEIPQPACSGPFTEKTVSALLDSPVRREIARRIVQGDSAVWVLLESEDRDKDAHAAGILEARLKQLEKELEIPTLAAEDAGLVSVTPGQLKVAFSLLRLARNDLAEAVLVQLLLNSESDLKDLQEPIVFPVYGRGRVLFALVGKGINEDNVDEASSFLVGPCSCQVKELNPGVDLLMTINWDDSIQSEVLVERPLPPLSGFAGLGDSAPAVNLSQAQAKDARNPSPGGSTERGFATAPTTSGGTPDQPVPLLPQVLLVGLIGLVLVGGATLVIILRK